MSDKRAETALNFVVLVEDDATVRERLLGILLRLGFGREQIHCAASLAEARRLFGERSYGLALVDIGLPDGSGIDLLRWLREQRLPVSGVVVSAWGTEELILAALRAGATGYLLKEREDVEILSSLRSLQQGGAPIDPFVAKYILRLVAEPMEPVREAEEEGASADVLWGEPLTLREREMLRWVALGFTSREIAERISRSKLTVECHIKNIYRKLHVHTRTEGVHQARSLGLLH